MKNVLLATAAMVAFAGTASAASHVGVSFSGEMTAGYNDEIESGLFFDANLDFNATVDMGDSIVATVSGTLFDWNNDGVSTDADITVDITYTGDVLSASLTMGDLGDKGASEFYYADRSGMAIDVENHDDDNDARAVVTFGNFGVAIGCEIEPGTGTCDQGAYNVGLGATFGSIELGVGYDNAAGTQTAVTAVSADATFGSFDIGVSYATSVVENSIGVEVGTTFGAISVDAYYASNSVSADQYGVSAEYASGPLTIGVYYDDDGALQTYGADVAYAVNDQMTINAGIFETDTASNMVYYVGMDYAINENVSATVSYATANEISGPEYKDGITALISASF